VQTVRIRKQKRPTGQMIWRAYVFTTDQFGTWLYSPEGTLVRGEKDGVIAFNEVGRGNRARGAHCIHLVPPGGWWFAIWADDGHARPTAAAPPRSRTASASAADRQKREQQTRAAKPRRADRGNTVLLPYCRRAGSS